MPDDNRLNFDDPGDLSSVRHDLLKDVAEATRMAKERKDADKAKDMASSTKGRDRTLMLVVVIVAALALIAIAWRLSDRSQPQSATPVSRPAVGSSTVTPAATYRPVMPQNNRPRPAQPPSEPVRRTPTDTYEQGPGHLGGM